MAIPNRVLKKMTNTKLKLSDLNPHLMCVLCGGYYIDATTIVECLHSFCRSCIVKHLEGSKYCPICEVQVHKTKPLINIRPDKTLQDIVYKLVPGLFASNVGKGGRKPPQKERERLNPKTDEMQNRRVFYQERPHYIKPEDSESVGEVSGEQKIFVNGENITFSLIYLKGSSPMPVDDRLKELTSIQTELRYFRCPTGVTIQHLKKLLKAKYELRGNNYKIDIFFKEESLNDEYTLLDVSYIYLWKTKDNLSLSYKIYECPAKRKRRRYFGGVDNLPAHYTPMSILQSRLGVLADSLPNEMSEGRRHLRSDIEKKRKEIEMKIQEERRLSERELRSHDEKKKEKEKEKDNKNEGKKKDKNGKNEEKKMKKKEKESKNHDEKKKDGKGGDDKKKELKNHEKEKEKEKEKKKKKKKDKEGKCQEETQKDKDDKEDKDDRKNDKDTKEEGNKAAKEGEKKRKREAEDDDVNWKREKREEEEKVADKKEEDKEDVGENTTSSEATAATAPEPAPTPTSTSTSAQSPTPTPAPASDPPQNSTSAEEGSVSTSAADSTTALTSASASASALASTSTLASTSEQASEPTSTTTENEQKTEESVMETEETPVSSEPSPPRERKATPPKESESKEARPQSTGAGGMNKSPVVENKRVAAKTVEEKVCVRVTRRSSITGATSRDEGVGNRETRKRGSNSKSSGEAPKEPKRKRGPKPSKIYHTIRRSPNVWHPSIPKEKLRPTLMNNTDGVQKPAKFFKLRNKSRLESLANNVKPVQQEPAIEEKGEEEELPRHEIEKEEAKVEPQPAQVAKKNEIEEEKRRVEEDKPDGISSNNSTALVDGPKTFGPLDKDGKYSTVAGASAPDLSNNLKGDPKTFGSLGKEDKCSKTVGANASDLPTNPKEDPKTCGLDQEDKRSTMAGGSAPDLSTNLKGDGKPFGVLDKEGGCSTTVGASAPNLPNNPKGDLKTCGLVDKEDRCSKIISANASNLLTNPFIPNSNHFLFSDVTLPPNSGNFSKSAKSKVDKSAPRSGISGIVSGSFKNPVPNGGNYSPISFLDPCHLVYSYQSYPAPNTDPLQRASNLPSIGNTGGLNPVSRSHTSLPPATNTLSSPHQTVQVVSLVSRKKNKDDSTKERVKSSDDSLNPNKTGENERKRRRRRSETEVTNMLKRAKETKVGIDGGDEEEEEGKTLVPAKRKRDEKGSREKDKKEEKVGKKEKGKEDKSENEKEKGDERVA